MQNARDFKELCREDKLQVIQGLKEGEFTIQDLKGGRVIVSDGFYTHYLRLKNPEEFEGKILIESVHSKTFWDYYEIAQRRIEESKEAWEEPGNINSVDEE